MAEEQDEESRPRRRGGAKGRTPPQPLESFDVVDAAPVSTARTERGTVFGRHPQSGLVEEVTAEEFSTHGYLPVEEEAAEAIEGRRLLRENLSPLDAVSVGLARGITGRLSDARGAADPAHAEYLRAIEEEYPGTSLAAEAASALGSLALPVTLPGAAARATQAGARVGGGVGARALEGAARGAAEAMFYGPGAAVSDSVVNNKELDGDLIWAHTAGLMGLGGALGAAGGAAGAAFRRGAPGPAGPVTGDEVVAQANARWRDAAHPKMKDVVAAAATGGEPEVVAALRSAPEYRDFLRPGRAQEYRGAAAVELAQLADEVIQPFEMAAALNAGRAKYKHVVKNVDEAFAPVAEQETTRAIAEARAQVETLLDNPAYQQVVEQAIREIPIDQQAVVRAQIAMDDVVSRMQQADLRVRELKILADQQDNLRARLQKRLARQKDELTREQVRLQIEKADVDLRQYREQHRAMSTEQRSLGVRMRELEAQLDSLQAPKQITEETLGRVPAQIQGHVQLRRYLGAIREAEMNIAEAAKQGTRAQMATRHVELDMLKKRAREMAKGGQFLGAWDDAAETMRRIHDDTFRPLLESDRVWGSGLGGLQREVNSAQHELLNLARHFSENFMEGSGRSHRFFNWVEGKQMSAAKVEKLLDALDDPTKSDMVLRFKRYVESNRKLGDVLERYYELSPSELSLLRQGRAASEKLVARMDDVADKMSFVNQLRLLGDNFGKELTGLRVLGSMTGAAVAGVPGALAGAAGAQAAMNILNPVPRLRTLAQIEHIRQRHDHWSLRLAERLLGGKGAQSRGGARAVEVAEQTGKRGRKTRLTPTAALMYNVFRSEDDEDSSAAFERAVSKFRAAANNPGVIDAGMRETAGWLEGQSPEVFELLKQKAAAAAKAVDKLAPPPLTQGAMLFPSLLKPQLGLATLDAVERQLEAIFDPKRAIERALEDGLTPEIVDILDEHHPHLMTDVRARVMEKVQSDSPPSFERRVQLSILLKIPADPTMTPEYIEAMQELDIVEQQMLEESQQQSQKRGTGRETGVNLSDAHYSRADRLELGVPPR